MTVTPHGGGDVAQYDFGADTGLEDVGVGDIVIPRLQIQHADAVFKDNLSGATYDSLKVVLLGLVKQRIMWHDEVDDGDKPLCKSSDFEHGFPNVRDDVPKDKRFPWDQSNFNPSDFPSENGMNGLVTLPCNACVFKEWDKNGWKTPPCAEQHTYPLLYSTDGETFTPALFTTQKTGIKPSRQYISSFAQSKTPPFTVFTELTLELNSRGSVRYSVPRFKRLEQTDRDMWPEYAAQLRTIREFVRQPPRNQEEADGGAAPSDNTNSAPAVPATTPPPAAQSAAAPAAAPAAAAPAEDDDLPF